ncbi:hypothetical protein [Actinoplanes siamensis]|uniref:Uncharacterized protein n=1 Tax=Actinoplanes siamensis TaxID=1223317 RepID=A0A919N5E7_9ACTN|nr:hypothetical protein [Actinoplanes siamensis]GIF04666.1 hypothetical protein Asi03nite_22040 [Actinoplanes siamensis]
MTPQPRRRGPGRARRYEVRRLNGYRKGDRRWVVWDRELGGWADDAHRTRRAAQDVCDELESQADATPATADPTTTPEGQHAMNTQPRPVLLRCPECGEPARTVAPSEPPMPEAMPRPAASHQDGTPLCPVPGPHGSQPADPITDPATPPPDGLVHLVAGGDMVAVFDHADSAAMQQAVMEAAGLDTVTARITPQQWDAARPLILTVNPGLVITDVRRGPAEGGAA